jgi:hypothetical protein
MVSINYQEKIPCGGMDHRNHQKKTITCEALLCSVISDGCDRDVLAPNYAFVEAVRDVHIRMLLSAFRIAYSLCGCNKWQNMHAV